MPQTVTDFRAWEAGNEIEFAFTLAKKTTDDLALESVKVIELGVGENSLDQHIPLKTTTPGEVTGSVPAQPWIGKTIVLAVRATGPKGRTSAWSNQDKLSVIPPLVR